MSHIQLERSSQSVPFHPEISAFRLGRFLILPFQLIGRGLYWLAMKVVNLFTTLCCLSCTKSSMPSEISKKKNRDQSIEEEKSISSKTTILNSKLTFEGPKQNEVLYLEDFEEKLEITKSCHSSLDSVNYEMFIEQLQSIFYLVGEAFIDSSVEAEEALDILKEAWESTEPLFTNIEESYPNDIIVLKGVLKKLSSPTFCYSEITNVLKEAYNQLDPSIADSFLINHYDGKDPDQQDIFTNPLYKLTFIYLYAYSFVQ